MTMYKPLCRIGYYAYDSFEAPCPLRTGEADAVAYLADDPVQPKDTPIDGDVDIIEMKTEHIDSDTIGNRAWKYTVGQELDENDVNRVVIYTTGIREKAK